MSKTIIKVEDLTKEYVLRQQNRERYTALRDVISQKTKQVLKGQFKSPSETETFQALHNLNFEIKQGDRVGIVGRNGAGKSTLLKVLSRIVAPTYGRITIEGRVASLLEVGTGFHPELSGRENIFLNGSILGMSRKEIKSKFDEIVAFSEVERFLDTPVKRYSSGMYVRLAFSVAAHLEPEILIVDEVLAVGDAAFQRKCLGKMKDVSGEGRTILFVSHNMSAIQNLCNRGLYMRNGKLIADGNSDDTIKLYLRDAAELQTIDLTIRKDRKGNGALRFTKVSFLDGEFNPVQSLQSGQKGIVQLHFRKSTSNKLSNLQFSFGIDDEYGNRLTLLNNEMTGQIFDEFSQESGIVQIHIPQVSLQGGVYGFTLFCMANNEIADYIIEAGTFSVEEGDFFNTGKNAPQGQGNFYINHGFFIK